MCASVMVGAALACTKVEPPAPLPPPAAAPAPVAAPAPRPAPRRPSPWGNTTASASPAAAALPPDAGTDGKGVDRAALASAIEGVLPKLGDCFSGTEGTGVSLSFHADPSGAAKNVKVSGASADVERCVTARIAAVKLPPFEGGAVAVQMPLTVRREEVLTAPPAAEAEPAAPQPLFVKP